MTRDDESLLSAYLDGELEPEHRLLVESTLATDARLAEQAQALASVRDLIANLPRPVCRDLSPAIMQRIGQNPLQPRTWVAHRRSWSIAGVAAAVLAAIIFWPHSRPGRRVAVDASAVLGPNRPDLSAAGKSLQPANLAGSAGDALSRRAQANGLPEQVFDLDDGSTSVAVAFAHPTPLNEQARVRKLLDDPQLRRVFLVADHIVPSAERQVASVVERTTHRDYFKITVSQGIVVDPLHPGKAFVFAVVLDESELTPFRDRLRKAFNEQVEEHDVDPAVAMHLADIGQVVSFPANPIGDLTIPGSNLALRAAGLGDPNNANPDLVAADTERDGPTTEQERSSPAIAIARPKESDQKEEAARNVRGGAAEKVARAGPIAGTQVGLPPSDRRHNSPPRAGVNVSKRDLTMGPLPPASDRPLIVLVWITETGSG